MGPSKYIGRIGGLAAALGVGAAIFTGPGIAWADPTSDTSPGSSSGTQARVDDDSSTPGPRAHSKRGARPADSTPSQSASGTGLGSADAGAPDSTPVAVAGADPTPRRGTDSAASTPQHRTDLTPSPAATTPTKSNSDSRAITTVAADASTSAPATAPAPAPAASSVTAAPAATLSVPAIIQNAKAAVAPAITSNAVTPAPGLQTAIATVANRISTVITSVVTQLANTFSGSSPFAPQVDSPANWLLLAAARRQPLAAATGAAAASTTATPTLVLNGFGVVPDSVQIIDAFTGRWAYWPGQPNMLQGRQDFNLVDPNTGEAVGSFSALVTSGDPTSIGSNYVQMLVTSNDGTNVGTEAGQTPPVGSLISEFTLGLVGLSYSSMPTASGDKVSVKLKTVFGSIPLPLTYDGAKGIADRTFDNRPMDITGGFSIAPADPEAEKITATIGLLPGFNSLQASQKFGVYDSNGNQVGSFDGEFTTTSDILGIYTQAILVTGNDGINVGTKPGQTPPVGTVYNVAYFGSDKVWLLYSSMPAQSGDVISLKFATAKGVTDLSGLPIPQVSFNASREPAMKPLIAPGGQKFVPTSVETPVGVNGLPPRDMQTQGYQQFDVYDFLGRKIGTVDADVQSQWDGGTGTHSKAILITKVTSGDVGATPLTVPPVGTVMNFIDFGNGFGITDSVIPQNGVNLNSFQFTTLLGNIPLLPTIIPANHPEVEYTNPFV